MAAVGKLRFGLRVDRIRWHDPQNEARRLTEMVDHDPVNAMRGKQGLAPARW
jgi:hypothetical protein